MARRPARRAANPAAATDGIEPVGTIRRSQLVSTFGIGAIVDLEKGSFMPMGLEDWERVNGFPSLRIGERRLEEMLGDRTDYGRVYNKILPGVQRQHSRTGKRCQQLSQLQCKCTEVLSYDIE